MARRPPRSRGSRSGGVWLFLLGLAMGAGALYFYIQSPAKPSASPAPRETPAAPHRKNVKAAERAAVSSDRSDRSDPSDRSETAEPAPAGTPVTVSSGPVHGARVALVIDDLGRSVDDLRLLAALGVPVTYAVLPFETETPAVVAELRRRHAEILLHLPMEPKNGENPGPGALLERMTDDELRQKTIAALRAVPGAVGVNNHMGSLLSSEEGPMNTVLGVIGERRLFFLDSRTSAGSVGYKVATGLGIPAAERQIFLDGDPAPEAIRVQFERLLELARAHGAAIAIGHPHPATLAVLVSEVPKAKAAGYDFVPVSYLLTRPGGE
ncbi:MAG TPA: divergent polysaccharide deacetylase family protein [Thermoanaerobaculia bacterium]|nr:divergent polysaccharide deacetylase family protein [Thermoanaerobaculia bacterium]